MEEARRGTVSLDSEWSIPLFRADFLCFASKIVEHSRYLLTEVDEAEEDEESPTD